MKKICVIVLLMAVMIVGAAGCSYSTQSQVSDQQEQKIMVVVSILPQKTFVEKVGGDRVEVTVMIPPGASPAAYQPTPQQLKDITKADMYVKVGSPIPFEKVWMEKIVSLNTHMKVVDCAEGVEIIENDPHIWLSPVRVKTQVKNIYQGLVELDPENAAVYEENMGKFLEELDELDSKIEEYLQDILNKKFIVFHPAWGYFSSDYGLEQIPIQVEGKDPSAAQMQGLIDMAKAEGIRVIFVQEQFSTKNAETVADTIGGKVIKVNPLASDYVENLKKVARAFRQGMNMNE